MNTKTSRCILTVVLFCGSLLAKTKAPVTTLRWQSGTPGCEFREAGQSNLYTFVTDEMVVALTVDSRELTQSQKRAGRVVGVLLSVEDKTSSPLLVKQSDASLEFVGHSQWRFGSWDADNLANHIQNQTDDLMHQTDKDLEKRPGKVEKNEDRLREQQKLVSEMVDFLSTQGLRDTTLDAAHPKISGWVFFPSRGKWVGSWKKREEFVFRIPVGGWMVEFPFILPPDNRPKLKERPD